MSLISCKDVALAYDGKTVAEGLSFEIEQADYVCVVGENGSGKSTLIKALLGLKEPKSGSITFGDGLKQNEIGYLPQQTPVQKDFPASAWEVVISGCLNKKMPFYTAADKALATNNMKLLNIEHLKKSCYRELSGGQQQRVLLARALCSTKKLILLDEPVTGLDPVMTLELYQLIKKINTESGITIIMVSHDIHCAVEQASKVLHLSDHKIAFFGTKADYLKTATGQRFLGGCEHV